MTSSLEADREAVLLQLSQDASARAREEAFDEIFHEFRERVLSVCLHIVGNRSDAEDALQEVFLIVFRGLRRFRGESRLSTWIYRIAIRTAFRVRRRPSAQPLEFEPATETRDPSLQRERSRQILAALACLSADHQSVIALFALEGLSHREIAETLGIAEGTVWSRLHLARKKLAAELRAMGY